ncbi:MAG: hypothetical protein WCY71_10850 [Halothiobacillaceae bacterium]
MGEEIRKAVAPLKAEIADLRRQLDEAKSQAPELPDIKGMVESTVAEAVKAIPAPKDGKSFTLDDVRPILGDAIKQLRQDADDAIAEPLKQAEAARDTLLKAVGELRQPEDGKSVTLDDVRPVLGAAIEESKAALDAATKQAQEAAQKAMDAAANLRQPEDGKSFTLEDAKPIIDKAVELICEDAEKAISEAVKAIPVPKDGVNGTSVTVDDVRPLIEAEIDKAVKQIPVPKDGIGMAGAMIDRDGNLIITMTNGETKELGRVVGKDGLSLESFEMTYDAEDHEVVLKAVAAGRIQEVRYPAGGIQGKGYWRDGNKAKAGEAWTSDGSLWIARKDTSTKPSTSNDAWFLAARAGRNGETVIKKVKEGPQPPIKLGKPDEGGEE